MNKLGIVIALKSEAQAILDNPAYRWKALPGDRFSSAALPLEFIISGVGKAYAAWAYAVLAPVTDAVLSMGTSGGLSDEAIGSIFRVSEFVEHDMCVESLGGRPGVTPYGPLVEPIMRPSGPEFDGLLEKACRQAGLESAPGRAMAGDEFITDSKRAAQKRDYFKASVVDMETAAMAKLALSRAGKPFAALRIVSDNANHEAGTHWEANLAMASSRFDAILMKLGPLAASDFLK
jgi:adenosylhomocysteine nucleosidase